MNSLLNILKELNSFLWGGPMLFLLFGTHLYFTFRLGFIQKDIKHGIKLSLSSEEDANGNASSFSTLTTTLAATLGTGNIVGISTAIALGGPGGALIGMVGLLQGLGVLEGVPILALGVPAVLSCYFDLFSGFVQAYVFSLLTMVYISGSLPEPEAATN